MGYVPRGITCSGRDLTKRLGVVKNDKVAIPMIQLALVLMGDNVQYHVALRKKVLLQYLNSQLRSLLKESDFKGV